MNDIEYAKSLLKDDKTCILVKGDVVYLSDKRGIAPLLYFLNNNIDLNGFSIADRIIGKAAALLCIQAGIKEVFGEVMSVKGKEELDKRNIPNSCVTLTEMIINRKGDDICPMEKTVKDIDDPLEAYKALDEKVKSLMK